MRGREYVTHVLATFSFGSSFSGFLSLMFMLFGLLWAVGDWVFNYRFIVDYPENGVVLGYWLCLILLGLLFIGVTLLDYESVGGWDLITCFLGLLLSFGFNALLIFGFGAIYGKVLMNIISLTVSIIFWKGTSSLERHWINNFQRPIRQAQSG